MVDIFCMNYRVGRLRRNGFRSILIQLNLSDKNFTYIEDKHWLESYFVIKGTKQQLDYLEDYLHATV